MEVNYTEAGKGNNNLKRKGGGKDELTARPHETRMLAQHHTIGWTKCSCGAEFKAGVVLDPFCGASTTLLVAKKLGRQYLGIELNPEYIELSERRIKYAVHQEELF